VHYTYNQKQGCIPANVPEIPYALVLQQKQYAQNQKNNTSNFKTFFASVYQTNHLGVYTLK
jgi:hypothetical protein